MHTTFRILVLVISTLAQAHLLAAGAHQDEAKILLKSAAHQELVKGDLEAAIETYQKILDQYPEERNVAAEALLSLGMSYEKLGRAEARVAYKRLLSDYADQSDQAQKARVHLARLEQAEVRTVSGPRERRIWVYAGSGVTADFTGTPSPDGRYFSLVEWSKGDVASFDLQRGEYRYLTGQANSQGQAYSSAFSPDGANVAYSFAVYEEDVWEIRIVAVDEERQPPPQTVFKAEQYLHVNDWSPKGRGILISLVKKGGQSGLGFLTPDTGNLTVLKTFERNTPLGARISPSGGYIAYDFPTDPDKEARDIFLLTSNGSKEEQIIAHPADDRLIGWSPSGEQIIFTSDRSGKKAVWAQPVAQGKAIGDARLIKSAVGSERFIGVTSLGQIYFHERKRLSDIFTVQIDPREDSIKAKPERLESAREGTNRAPSWSPDGNYLAYRSGEGTFSGNLIIRTLKEDAEQKIETDSIKVAGLLSWSPDSRYILCTAKRASRGWSLWLFERSTEQFRLVRAPGENETILYPVGWSPDGKEIYFYSLSEGWSVRVRNLETGLEREVYRLLSKRGSSLSPDAKHLAIPQRDGTKTTLVLVSTINGEVVETIYQHSDPDSSIGNLQWSPDGHYIYFTTTDKEDNRQLFRISSQGEQLLEIVTPIRHNGRISISPDGRQFAFASGEAQDELWVMENFLSTE